MKKLLLLVLLFTGCYSEPQVVVHTDYVYVVSYKKFDRNYGSLAYCMYRFKTNGENLFNYSTFYAPCEKYSVGDTIHPKYINYYKTGDL